MRRALSLALGLLSACLSASTSSTEYATVLVVAPDRLQPATAVATGQLVLGYSSTLDELGIDPDGARFVAEGRTIPTPTRAAHVEAQGWVDAPFDPASHHIARVDWASVVARGGCARRSLDDPGEYLIDRVCAVSPVAAPEPPRPRAREERRDGGVLHVYGVDEPGRTIDLGDASSAILEDVRIAGLRWRAKGVTRVEVRRSEIARLPAFEELEYFELDPVELRLEDVRASKIMPPNKSDLSGARVAVRRTTLCPAFHTGDIHISIVDLWVTTEPRATPCPQIDYPDVAMFLARDLRVGMERRRPQLQLERFDFSGARFGVAYRDTIVDLSLLDGEIEAYAAAFSPPASVTALDLAPLLERVRVRAEQVWTGSD